MSSEQSWLTGTALAAFGLLTVVFFGLVGWAAVRAARFQGQERPFVVAFTRTLSRNWQLADVRDQFADPARPALVWRPDDSAAAEIGRDVLVRSRVLGPLREAMQVRLVHYVFNLHTETGEFTFRGRFEHGQALVRVRLMRSGGATRVLRFELSQVEFAGSAAQVGRPAVAQLWPLRA